MPDDEPAGEGLPSVLPPEEVRAKDNDAGPSLDRAQQEMDLFERELSGHTVEAAALRNELARAHIKNVEADREMRVTYAGRILLYLECYSGGVAALLLLSGFKFLGFALETGILAALVGSTALAAIGLVGFIARGLFRPPPPPPSAL